MPAQISDHPDFYDSGGREQGGAGAFVHDLIILGAGASGMMCARTAAERGKSALLIDHADKPCRKLAISGGGKCNFTNKNLSERDYAGENPDFCRSALARFSPAAFLDMLRQAKIAVEERECGQVFCARSAKDLVNMLINDCLRLGCRMALGEKILSAARVCEENGARFAVHTSRRTHFCRNLALALGGPAWPRAGAGSRGFELAKSFGHSIVPVRPVLVGLVMGENWPLSGLAGIALPVSLELDEPDHGRAAKGPRSKTVAENLALLFTHTGISGPAVLQASLYWRKGRKLRVNFLPGTDPDEIFDEPGAGKSLCRNLLRKHLPERLVERLVPDELGGKKAAELSRAERSKLRELLRSFTLSPAGTEGFARAEASAGGVSTRELSSRDLQSKLVPGLYFCGEILDVTGRLGGYNLHWAFASGRAVGGCA